jgi:hypothetical protein
MSRPLINHRLRNEILETAARVADNCKGLTCDNDCTDDGYNQAKRHIAAAIRSLKIDTAERVG